MTRLAALLLWLPLGAAAGSWQVVPGEGRLEFTAWWEDTAVPGRFPAFTADIRFDPQDPGAGRFAVEVDLTRVTTGIGDVDAALGERDWFHFGRHPRARFLAEGFRAVGPGQFEADGTLTLKGVSRELVFPFAWEQGDGQARLRSTVTLDRGRWGIGAGEWAGDGPIALAVEVRVDLALTPATP